MNTVIDNNKFPARYVCNGPEGTFYCDNHGLAESLIQDNAELDRDEWTITDTQQRTLAASKAGNAQAEWALVPRVPTPEMIGAFRADAGSATMLTHTSLKCADFDSRYSAMLAAAPEPSLSGDGGPVSNASEVEYHGGSGKSYATMEAAKQAGESSIIGPLTFTDRQPIGVTIAAASEGVQP